MSENDIEYLVASAELGVTGPDEDHYFTINGSNTEITREGKQGEGMNEGDGLGQGGYIFEPEELSVEIKY